MKVFSNQKIPIKLWMPDAESLESGAWDQVKNLAREQGIDLLVSREKENSYKCEINESD